MRGLILYTHFFRGKGAHLRGLAMASVDSFAEADEAVNAGWRAAVALPVRHADCKTARAQKMPVWQGEQFTTPEGKPILICPQQTGKADDCNSCGLCDAQTRCRRPPHTPLRWAEGGYLSVKAYSPTPPTHIRAMRFAFHRPFV